MRKTLTQLAAAIALGVGSLAGAQAAPLLFDFDGAGGNAAVTVTGFDWGPTSFVAINGNTAAQAGTGTFTVLTHAKMIGYLDANGTPQSLPTGAYEITMVASFQEQVITSIPAVRTSFFQTTGAGRVELYYDSVADSVGLTGYNFNDGRLIGVFDGVSAGKQGSFQVTGGPVLLDQFNGDQYAGQQSVSGSGNQEAIQAGTVSSSTDATFFQNGLSSLTLSYANFSIALPYITAEPSDCYTPVPSGTVVGTTYAGGPCLNVHANAQMSGQAGPGYVPVIGTLNGGSIGGTTALVGGPDFVAQTDFNSPVAVTAIPEPGMLAMLGVAFAGLGLSRRRSTK